MGGSFRCTARRSKTCAMASSRLASGGRRRFFQEGPEPLADLRRNGNGSEVLLPDADENVPSARDRLRRLLAPAHLEVEVDRRSPDPAEVRLDDEELVELHRLEELALDAPARQPDAEGLVEELVVEPGRPEELRLREREEPQVRLVVDDPGGVDVLPADVLFDRVAAHEAALS